MNAVLSHPSMLTITRQQEDSKDIRFSYKSTLIEVFHSLILEAIKTNKRVIVTSCNAKDLRQLFELVSSNYKLAMHIDNEFITKECINKWRLAYKKQSNVHKRLEWSGSAKSVDRYFSEATDYFEEIYQNNSSSLWKLTSAQPIQEFQLYMPILEYCIPAHLFNGTDIEFTELNELVQKFAKLFRSEFNLLKQINYVDEYTSNSNGQTIIPLEDLSRKINELTILFLNNINAYKENWKSQLQNEHKKATRQLRSLHTLGEKLSTLQAEIEKTGSLFDKLTSGIQSRTQKENYKYAIEIEFDNWLSEFSTEFPKLFAEYSISEESTIEPNIKSLRTILQSHISDLIKQKQLEGQQQFNQLNAQNCPAIFTEILSELRRFYKELNEYNLLETIGSDKSFNLQSSYQYLLKVKEMIESLLLMNQTYPSFISWKKELNTLNSLEKLIILSLAEQIPDNSHWPEIFKEYYINILKAISKPAVDIKESIAKYIEEVKKQEAIEKESLNNLQHYFIRTHIEKLKVSNQDLYKKLFQKKFKEHSLSIYPMLTEVNELLPLCFIRKEILSQSDRINESWDLHIHVDLVGQPAMESMIASNGKEFIKLQYTTSADSQIQIDSNSYLKHPKIQTDEDHLNFCRTLSQKLVSYQHRIQIFNCGDIFIVSFLHKLLNIKLLETNEHLVFKEFVLDNDLNYSLEDILLNNPSSIQILVQDGVLDPANSASLDWQLHVIDLMKRSGMNVQSISLSEIMNGNDTSLLLTKSNEPLLVDIHTQTSPIPEFVHE